MPYRLGDRTFIMPDLYPLPVCLFPYLFPPSLPLLLTLLPSYNTIKSTIQHDIRVYIRTGIIYSLSPPVAAVSRDHPLFISHDPPWSSNYIRELLRAL